MTDENVSIPQPLAQRILAALENAASGELNLLARELRGSIAHEKREHTHNAHCSMLGCANAEIVAEFLASQSHPLK